MLEKKYKIGLASQLPLVALIFKDFQYSMHHFGNIIDFIDVSRCVIFD